MGIIAIIAIALVAFVGCAKKTDGAAKAPVDNTKITIVNNTGSELNEMLISPVSNDSEWEETNYLEGKTVKDGESFQVEKTIFAKAENYDLTFTSTDETPKDYFKMDVDVKNITSLTVTKDDFTDLSDTTTE